MFQVFFGGEKRSVGSPLRLGVARTELKFSPTINEVWKDVNQPEHSDFPVQKITMNKLQWHVIFPCILTLVEDGESCMISFKQ